MKIKALRAREILDSRGNPTVECSVILENSLRGTAAVPSGASTGSHEALELRDGNKKRYGGKGVLRVIHNIERLIAPIVVGKDTRKQEDIDRGMLRLDGTENKSRLGANATLAVSLAVARAGALASKLPLYKYLRKFFSSHMNGYKLPLPMMNVLNGGAHAGWSLDIQEFMIVPHADKFKERVRIGSEVFHALGQMLTERGERLLVGDEGGYAPKLEKNEEALQFITSAISRAGYTAGKDIFMAMDAAASEFFNNHAYELKVDGKVLRAKELHNLYMDWLTKYPIISLEDPFAEDDWDSWKLFKLKTQNLKSKTKRKWKLLIVGDDLFTTNIKRLKMGVELGVANAILIKPNQIGTLTETLETIQFAQKHNYKVIISHRSGETCDSFIADLAVAVGADFIKAGSLSREERLAKYNRLMEIEDEVMKG